MGHRAVFTHNDLDGLVSALLARVAMPDAAIYFCDYGGLAGVVRSRLARHDDDVIWFTDLSMRDVELFSELQATSAAIYWFDHHASSLPQDWMQECRIDTSGERSASDVVRDYLVESGYEIPLPLQTLCDYSHDQDLWVREIDEAQQFNDILGSMPIQQLFDLITADLGRVYHWTDEMRAACRKTQEARQRSQALAEATSVWQELGDGFRLRGCCCWGSVSEVGDLLGDEQTIVVLLDLRQLERGQIKYSFRSQSSQARADRLAEQLGGGGHPQASGAPAEIDLLKALSAAALGPVLDAAHAINGGGE